MIESAAWEVPGWLDLVAGGLVGVDVRVWSHEYLHGKHHNMSVEGSTTLIEAGAAAAHEESRRHAHCGSRSTYLPLELKKCGTRFAEL